MITSKINNAKPELNFPLLARNIRSKRIVLFVSGTCGTIVFCEDNGPFGFYSDNWVSLHDPQVWEILSAGTEIILKQN